MKFSKALATIVGALASILLAFNIDVSQEVQAAIITLITAGVVVVSPPNK